ncbi:acanthoscurrin-2-like [Panicum virgatum]|uniref:acanthoscurrin-2-like n=1 Tax=Panicum virgatum TaxID=38727 RepID=UPI0019D668F4|nr:acanthoscurrin-2-like [Panicum virgatum]
MSGGGVEIGLSSGGLPLSFLGAGQGSSAGCLGCACFFCSEASGACSVSVDFGRGGSSSLGGSSFGGVVVDTRRHGARPGGRTGCGTGGQRRGVLGAAPVGGARVQRCRQRKGKT